MNRTTKLLALGLLLLGAPANAEEGKGHDMHDMKGMHEMHGNMSDAGSKSEAAAAFAEVALRRSRRIET